MDIRKGRLYLLWLTSGNPDHCFDCLGSPPSVNKRPLAVDSNHWSRTRLSLRIHGDFPHSFGIIFVHLRRSLDPKPPRHADVLVSVFSVLRAPDLRAAILGLQREKKKKLLKLFVYYMPNYLRLGISSQIVTSNAPPPQIFFSTRALSATI
jgi:hypothetical protein